MADDDKERKYPPPFSLRLTFEEMALLDQYAGDMPKGAYIRSCVFANPTPRKRKVRRPIKDRQELARLLAELGTSRLGNNINQLAKATHTGALPATPEIEKLIRESRDDIDWMRRTLVRALGLREAAE